jgi:hypothetical protein
VLLTVLALLLTAVTSVAQQGTGRVRGQVLDGSDAVVPGATVEVLIGATVMVTTVTDDKGQFDLPKVPAGPVKLKLSLDGFETSTFDLVVQPGLETWVSGLLKVAALAETVLVTAPAPPPPTPRRCPTWRRFAGRRSRAPGPPWPDGSVRTTVRRSGFSIGWATS